MQFRRLVIAGIASIAVLAFDASAASVFRIEVHPVPTLDLTTAQVLNGETSGHPGMVAGELRLPATAALRVPAVIVLHGDAGAIANQAAWNNVLSAAGIAVFTLDSFTGRNAISATTAIGNIEGAGKVTAFGRVVDAYKALALLSQHPRIDSTRIALMGFFIGRQDCAQQRDDTLRANVRGAEHCLRCLHCALPGVQYQVER